MTTLDIPPVLARLTAQYGGEKSLLGRSDWSGRIYDGQWVDGAGGSLEVTEKATGERIGVVGVAAEQDIAGAVRKAQRAQRAWAARSGGERGDVLRAFAALVQRYSPELENLLIRETGSVAGKAAMEMVLGAAEAHEAAGLTSHPEGVLLASPQSRPSLARRVPIGVVGAILPWNSPFLLALRAIAPALTLGNAVLLKPDPQTPIIGGVVLAELFREAGLPEGLLCVLPGGVETGEALVRQPDVGMIAFTGSTRGGRRVGAAAGGLLKRVSLELGGNNAFVVLDDADISRAVDAAMFAAYFHQGQICMAAGRQLIHESVAEEYTALMVQRTRDLVVGDPLTGNVDLGPMINERQVERAVQMLTASLTAGATLLAGGTHDGLFFEPTVLGGVTPDMPVFAEERFFPVSPITLFSSDEQAVHLANDTEYGLVAAVHSTNPDRAMAVADQLRTGMVHINDQSILHEVTAPMGGFGSSGNGSRYGGLTNVDEFTQWRWYTVRDQAPDYSLHS